MINIEAETGLIEETCYFALSFRFISQSKTWILCDEYSTSKMWHTHAFFHSYSNRAQSSISLPQEPAVN